MKKVLSAIVAALVAISFAGLVCAAEPAPAALPAGHPPIKKEEKKAVKKAKKAKKAAKKAAETPAAPAVPATPAAPAAK